MGGCGKGLMTVVAQCDGDVGFLFGDRHKEYVLEAAWLNLGFRDIDPFLKEGGKTVLVKGLARGRILHLDSTVAFERHLVEARGPSVPSRCLRHVVDVYAIALRSAREDIIHAERAVVEILLECFSAPSRKQRKDHEGRRYQSLHDFWFE